MKNFIISLVISIIIICPGILLLANISDYTLSQGFTSTTFPPTGWLVVYTGTNYWTRNSVSARCLGAGSAKFDFYTAPAGVHQDLITPQFAAAPQNSYLDFSYAYCTYTTEVDTLRIFCSTNGGFNWSEIITLLGGVNGQLVTAPPQQSVFTPNCTQWGEITLLIPVIGTNKIRFSAGSAFGNNLYIDSIGVYTITGINNGQSTKPKTFLLYQNYPNPFNPQTVINYQLPVTSNVRLIIYDNLGKEVSVLVNEKQNAGVYNAVWNGSDYPSGVYYYKLDAGYFSQTKKLILLK